MESFVVSPWLPAKGVISSDTNFVVEARHRVKPAEMKASDRPRPGSHSPEVAADQVPPNE